LLTTGWFQERIRA